MAQSSVILDVPVPEQPHEYNDDDDIPFAPDGNSSLIGGSVEKVKGRSPPFKDIKYARKTVWIIRKWGEYDDPTWRQAAKDRLIRDVQKYHDAQHDHVIRLAHTYFYHQQGDEDQIRFSMIMDRADENLRHYFRWPCYPDNHWFGCMLEAVRHIHALGIPHGNIKPENILIRSQRVLLSDFALSQVNTGATGPVRVPQSSREYIAPKVGEWRTCVLSADIFSLGAVFLEMVAAFPEVDKYGELSNILITNWQGNLSFTESIDKVCTWLDKFKKWVEEERGSLHCQAKVLSACQRMLNPEKNRYPSAEELCRGWSNEFWVCQCNQGSIAQTDHD